MVMTKEETIEIQEIKYKHRMELEELKHAHIMQEIGMMGLQGIKQYNRGDQ